MSEMMQLRAWLVDSEPEIWRRLVLDPRLTLEQLHTVLQHAFGWTDIHLHHFFDEQESRYARPSEFDWERPIDERKACLSDVFEKPGAAISYEYDFGDGWMHCVAFEEWVDSETIEYPSETFIKAGKTVSSGKTRAAMCIAGARSGPPEDCGGIHGYYDLIEIMRKPRAGLSADDKDRLEWLGDWDFERFRLDEINQMIGRVRVRKAFLESR